MPRKAQEIWIGLFAIVGLLLLGVLILTFSELYKATTTYYTVSAHFKTATGIEKGTPVRLMGLSVGEVERVWIDEGIVKMILKVDIDYHIKSDAQLVIKSRGILGDYYLEFDAGTLEVADLATDGTAGPIEGRPPVTEEIVEDVRRLVGALSNMATDEETQKKVKQALDTLAESVEKVPELIEEARKAASDAGVLISDARGLISDFTNVAEQAKQLSENLDKKLTKWGDNIGLVTDSLLVNAQELQTSLVNLNTILQRLQQIDEQKVYSEVISALKHAQRLMSEVENTLDYFRTYPQVFLWGTEEEAEGEE